MQGTTNSEPRRRRPAAEALHEIEERLRAIVASSLDAVISIDAQGLVIGWNPQAAAIFGWTEEEAIGRPLSEMVIPELQRPFFRDLRMRYLATGEGLPDQRIETIALRRDGTELPVELTTTATTVGETSIFTAFVRDISERRHGEEALRERERQYSLLVREAPVGIVGTDATGQITSVNPAALEILGSPGEEATKQFNVLTLPAIMRAGLSDRFAEVIATKQPRKIQATYISHWGKPSELRLDIVPLLDDSGETAGTLTIMEDITARKHAEDAQRQSEELLRATLASTADGILVVSGEGRVLYYSPRFSQMWRIPQHLLDAGDDDALLGHVLGQLTDPDAFLARVRALYRGAEESFDTLDFEDGRVFERYSRPLIGTEGLAGRVWSFRDITERRSLEAQFLRAQRIESVGRLAGGVAHDFNNLMTAIIGHAELAMSAVSGDGELRADLQEIRDTAARAAGLASQLLTFARRQIVVPRVLDLNNLIRAAEKMLSRLLGEDVDLRLVLAPDLAPVRIDPGQFEQVLVNLAVNARDAMPRGGSLTIETANDGDAVTLDVTDTGAGMSDEVKRQLFDPFFTTKEPGKGTGLGLATCYGIVGQAGGSISVRSELGRGSTFAIRLPRTAEAAPEPAESPDPESLPQGDETVLVVEDEPGVRNLAVRALRGLGYNVLEAADGADALRASRLHAGGIDLLLTDVVMPGIGGKELATRLRAARPRLRALFTSGHTDDEILRLGVLERDLSFLQKPFSPGSLARKVRESLDASPPAE